MLLLCTLAPLLALCPEPPEVPTLDGWLGQLQAAHAAPDDEGHEDDERSSPSPDAAPAPDGPDHEHHEDDERHERSGRYGVGEPWATLAECESGDWVDGGASFVEGSARWSWAAPGTEVPPWGTTLHHGGLQFHPDTWTWLAGDVLDDPPAHAYDATPQQQVAVGERVREVQGWQAWPVCSRKVGLR